MYVNSFVVVGDRFDPGMFNPEEFFGGRVDPAGRLQVGPVALFTYHGGRCSFGVNPQRVDVTSRSIDVMPDELHEAASQLLETLKPIRSAVSVMGLGFNCEGILVGRRQTGVDAVNGIVSIDNVRSITGVAESGVSTMTFQYSDGALRYSLRIEPEVQSEGRNLFVAINGHQVVAPDDRLKPKLRRFSSFQSSVRAIHERIASTL